MSSVRLVPAIDRSLLFLLTADLDAPPSINDFRGNGLNPGQPLETSSGFFVWRRRTSYGVVSGESSALSPIARLTIVRDWASSNIRKKVPRSAFVQLMRSVYSTSLALPVLGQRLAGHGIYLAVPRIAAFEFWFPFSCCARWSPPLETLSAASENKESRPLSLPLTTRLAPDEVSLVS